MGEQPPYRIIYLGPAQQDLLRLRAFLVDGGVDLAHAQELIEKIVVGLRILENNPCAGFTLGGKYGFNIPYRALITGRYVAVYEVFEDEDDLAVHGKTSTERLGPRVEIRRIYHGREDYISQLMHAAP